MLTVWFNLKRSLHCKEATDVHVPKPKRELSNIFTKKSRRSGCSRSISNLKDVIHGSKLHSENPVNCSPRSIGSSEFVNPMSHEVILSNSRFELKISGFGGVPEDASNDGGVGSLRPGTPGPGGQMQSFNPSFRNSTATPPRLSALEGSRRGVLNSRGGHGNSVKARPFVETDTNGLTSSMTCHKCGEVFGQWKALEAHHMSKHAATELVEGDSSRKIVEIICRSSWLKTENHCGRIEKVLKVHNMQKMLARFEEYREMVKLQASKLQTKHPRCIADGNELLRFYGTTVACSLGINGCTSLCLADKCCVCRIIRNGSSSKREFKGGIGVFTTSTSQRALESIEINVNDHTVRKALIVCRVIAGRVHKPLENIQDIAGQSGFDSLAGKVGLHSNIEELYLLNPRALLPCFVVICKT
ncbi:hypothetical protein ACET3Z_021576 [Daucus carota]